MNDETELLRRFADEGSQEAFAGLVHGKLNLVYAAALRQTGGDAHLAEDVTQAVFIALAGRAAALKSHTVLTAWLYTTTRFLAIRAMRRQRRWQRREQEANAMTTKSAGAPEAWEQLRPVIDEAMHELGARDREALLLRFFEGRTFGEVGAAIGLAENSARMRVERALEKLGARLAGRGITSTATALGMVLANQPAVAAPAGFAATVAGTAVAGAATTVGTTGGGLSFMGIKLNVAVLGALLVVGVGTWWTTQRRWGTELAAVINLNVRQTRELAALRNERRHLTEEIRTLKSARSTGAAGSALPSAPANPEQEAVRSPEIIEQQRRAISSNLRQIAAAREMFIRSMQRAPGSLAEIVGYRGFLQELIPVDGEDYTRLNLAETKVFSVTTANGLAVSYNTEGGNMGTPLPGVGGRNAGPPGLGAKVRKALAGFMAAKGGGVVLMPRNVNELLPFFDNAVDAADYVEWLESIQWPSP